MNANPQHKTMPRVVGPLDIDEIKRYLPHRYPMLMIDRVLELVPGEHVVALKNVAVNENVFAGHFPNKPIFPGMLILEAMAQAAGVLGFFTMKKTPDDGSIYYFVGADEVRFKRPVVPGDQLLIRADVVSDRQGVWKFNCRAEVDGTLAAKALILCADRSL